MGDKIKTAIEIALEKAALLDDLSEEEKEEIENKKKIGSLMALFYKLKVQPEDLWAKLKDSKLSMLKLVQLNLIESLNFTIKEDEMKRRIKAIIAVESLKKEQKTSAIQQSLSMLENLIKRAETEKAQVFEQFKNAVENNPQARNRVIEQNGAKVVLKLTLEEAIYSNPQWKQFISEFEAKNTQEFSAIISAIKKNI